MARLEWNTSRKDVRKALLVDAVGGGLCPKHGEFIGHGKYWLRDCPYCDIEEHFKKEEEKLMAEKGAEYTKWEVFKGAESPQERIPPPGRSFWVVWIVDKDNQAVAQINGYDTKATADLICSLHNMAVSINPSNPLAVAEGMGEVAELLREISEGKGAYSRDPLTHASNTIENMKNLALEALSKITGGK